MRRGNIFWGVVIILAGLLFLLNNLNLLSVNIWGLFWPSILILLGLWFLWGVSFGRRNLQEEQVSLPLDAIAQVEIHVHHGAGRLSLRGSAQPTELMSGTFSGGLERELKRNADQAVLQLRAPAENFWMTPWVFAPTGGYTWSFSLNDQIPIRLDLRTGASETNLDLSNLRVTDLHLETGASSTDVTFPANAGYTRAEIKAGAASVAMRIPASVAGRIRVQSGLSGISINSMRFPRSGEYYESPDYANAANKVDIYVETGVGSIDIH